MPRRFYRSRRSYRTRRYGRRALSTRNIYAHRSNMAQATQIAALKKKVNRVYKACKPEMKVVHGDVFEQTFSNGTLATNYKGYVAPEIAVGAEDYQRVGNYIWRRDEYEIRLTYSNNAASTSGLHNHESSCAQMRFICGIWKDPSSNTSFPGISDVIHDYASTGQGYRALMVQPLRDGITMKNRIVYDKVFAVGLTKPQTLVRIRTPWYSCRYDNYTWNTHSWIMCVAGDLDYDTTFDEHLEIIGTRKTIYKDA